MFGAIPLVSGWLLIGFAQSLATLLAGRIFFGFSYGFIYSVLPIYLGEIASDQVRGYVSTWLIVMGKSGVVFVFSVAPFVSIPTMAWIGLISPIAFVVTFMWLPESPYFLLGQNRQIEARQSLQRLRRHSDVEDELHRMDLAVRRSQENRGTFRELLAIENRRSLVIIFGLATMQYLCGNSAIMDYSQTIFSKIHSSLEAHEISIVLAVVSLVSVLIGNYCIDMVGRKPLLLVSVGGTGICTTVVGLYFFLERHAVDVTSVGWVPITSLMLFKVCHGLGLSIVVFALLAEMFPKNLKAVVTSTFTIFAGLTDVLVSKLFQTISDNWGSDVSFWIFAVFSYGFIVFIVCLIPETKGKPLEDILVELRSGWKSKTKKISI